MGRERRWREVNVEGHGAAKSWAVMAVSPVVSSEHLGAGDFGWLEVHFQSVRRKMLGMERRDD